MNGMQLEKRRKRNIPRIFNLTYIMEATIESLNK